MLILKELEGSESWRELRGKGSRDGWRCSQAMLARKEYDVNTYLYSKNKSPGGGAPAGCEWLKRKELRERRSNRANVQL